VRVCACLAETSELLVVDASLLSTSSCFPVYLCYLLTLFRLRMVDLVMFDNGKPPKEYHANGLGLGWLASVFERT